VTGFSAYWSSLSHNVREIIVQRIISERTGQNSQSVT